MWGLTGFVPYLCLSPLLTEKKETFCAVQMRVQVKNRTFQGIFNTENSQWEFTMNMWELMGINWNLQTHRLAYDG